MPTDYDSATAWLAITLAGVLTFAIRGPFIYLFGRINGVPPTVKSALEYVPTAVFTALVFPALLAPSGDLAVSVGNDKLVAGAPATFAVWYTERVLTTILVGIDAFWVLRFVVWTAVSPVR